MPNPTIIPTTSGAEVQVRIPGYGYFIIHSIITTRKKGTLYSWAVFVGSSGFRCESFNPDGAPVKDVRT